MVKSFKFIVRYFYALLSCGFLFTIGIFFAKYRLFIGRIARYFGFRDNAVETVFPQRSMLPAVEASRVVSKHIHCYLPELDPVPGNLTVLESIIVCELIKKYTPQNIFEIGTFDGRTTVNMAANCSQESKVYTLDLPPDKVKSTKLQTIPDDEVFMRGQKNIKRRFCGTVYEQKIIQLYGDSAVFDFSPYKNLMDFILIDGSHSYQYALNDTFHALELLREDKGIIIWHDYMNCEGVTRVLHKLHKEKAACKNITYIKGTSLVYLHL